MRIRPYRDEDESEVVSLWGRCELLRPWNDPHKDITRKLKHSPGLFLVGELDGVIIGTVMCGYEGHRGWINYLAVSPEYRGRGYGTALMLEAERLLRSKGCPKINLQVRAENADAIRFYERVGFSVEQVINMGKRIEFDD